MPKNTKKKRVARKVDEPVREQMFLLWLDGTSIAKIAERCEIHGNTVRKVKTDDNWEERREGIRKKLQKKVDNSVAIKLKKELSVIDVVINAQAQALAKKLSDKEGGGIDLDLNALHRFLQLKKDYVEFVDPETPEEEPEVPDDPLARKMSEMGDQALDLLVNAAIGKLKQNAEAAGKQP